jgi:hypothetical protein
MTAKEKAKELVSKFNFEHTGETYIIHQSIEESKRCALITVDQLIEKEISLLGLNEDYIPTYYNWVKDEIEKL